MGPSVQWIRSALGSGLHRSPLWIKDLNELLVRETGDAIIGLEGTDWSNKTGVNGDGGSIIINGFIASQ
jgi:hypothetical protein